MTTAADTSYDVLPTSAAAARRLEFDDAMAGCGALWSSIEDMQQLLRAVLDPPEGQLGDAMRLAARTHATGRGHDQGLGWVLFRRGPAAGHLFHNGGTYGYRSALLADPATGRGVVALSSTDRSVDGLVVQVMGRTVGDVPAEYS